jgi:enoyl-CoA hydratase/carnithine racemase
MRQSACLETLTDQYCRNISNSFDAAEALEHGFISKISPDPAKVVEDAIATAKLIAEKSPVAAIGTKYVQRNGPRKLAPGAWKAVAVTS